MPLDTLDIDPGVPAAATLIVLHGLGADGNDFVPICDELDLSAIGPVRFVFPNAPVRPVTINGGHAMRAWYDILAMGGRGALMDSQQEWLRDRRKCGASRACLNRAYDQRLTDLDRSMERIYRNAPF